MHLKLLTCYCVTLRLYQNQHLLSKSSISNSTIEANVLASVFNQGSYHLICSFTLLARIWFVVRYRQEMVHYTHRQTDTPKRQRQRLSILQDCSLFLTQSERVFVTVGLLAKVMNWVNKLRRRLWVTYLNFFILFYIYILLRFILESDLFLEHVFLN